MKPQTGDAVLIRHRVTTLDGNEIENSFDKRRPMRFTIDSGRVIRGMNEAVKNLEVGQRKEMVISAVQAHGEYDEKKSKYVRKTRFLEKVTVGQKITFAGELGQQVEARVLREEDDIVVLDTNHPLAGKELVLDIELLEILEDSVQEPFI